MLFRSLESPGTRNSIFFVENCLHSKVFSLRLNLKMGVGTVLLDSRRVQYLFAWKEREEKGQKVSLGQRKMH